MRDTSPDLPPLLPHIERILDAAHIAPSHDNLQPWRFVVAGETISFLVDHERDRSPGGDGGRMARIAVGAAIECALLRAGRMGATVHFESPSPGALVTITFTGPKRVPEPDKALVRRNTNRRLYDGRPVDAETFTWLGEAVPPLDGVRARWFGRERVRALGPILEDAEALVLAAPRLRETVLRAVRFDARDREQVPHGLAVGALELSSAERMTLDALRHTPQDRLAAMGAFRKMGAHARRLVESASGVVLLSAPDASPHTDVAVGRSMQRAWLALTRRGLAAQPMTTVAALEGLLATDEGRASLDDVDQATQIVARMRGAFPSVERESRIALLMRFGWAPAPSSTVRRLPLQDSVHAPAETPGVPSLPQGT